jgi:hypothetical protein
MSNDQLRDLCISLIKADTETEVIALLKKDGYWDKRGAWRFYGDYENNYNTIGNQQSRPDAALVEKLVNSVDARLMNECLSQGNNPESPTAPQSIREAVALFFESNKTPTRTYAGLIREWPDSKRTQIARGITFAATGQTAKFGNLCFTISDCGEGQTPELFSDTLLSLNRSNKLRIPFVQGKFNMGGTGVLKFCGKHNLQLIVSRRNPSILKGKLSHPTDMQWGFSIVRREDPEGTRRSSVYTYLSPVGSEKNPGKGGVLRFTAESLPIFPEGRNAYSRMSAWGTLIKLYEYSATGYRSHILRKDGILGRIDLLLPDIALPMRLHECRSGYRGHEGSFETTLTGIKVRLEDDKAENIESDFPDSSPMNVLGEEMTVTIYAFKKGRADAYRKNEGIIFIVNGQTHGYLTQDFFTRRKAGSLSYLADSLLVSVDCSKLSGRAREDLFMNSRDRLSSGELRIEIERALEELLKNHVGLRALKERRRREEIAAKLDDSKPLEDILESLLKHSPTLSELFFKGKRISTPFKTQQAQTNEGPYEGNKFPTYFKFKGKNYGAILHRECHINMRCRIIFETDAKNDYFSRDIDRGEFHLTMIKDDVMPQYPVHNYILNLQNGIATLSLNLPERAISGQEIHLMATVSDPSRVVPFENRFTVKVKEAAEPSGDKSNRRKPPTDKEGQEREIPSGIQMPNIILVYETEWPKYNFDKYSALRIKNAGQQDSNGGNGDAPDIYDFFINMDNLYLKSELKSGVKEESEVIRARFKYGLVLVGLALLQQKAQNKKQSSGVSKDEETEQNEDQENIESRVETFSKALAPIIVPMIESLGAPLEDGLLKDGSGEAT